MGPASAPLELLPQGLAVEDEQLRRPPAPLRGQHRHVHAVHAASRLGGWAAGRSRRRRPAAARAARERQKRQTREVLEGRPAALPPLPWRPPPWRLPGRPGALKGVLRPSRLAGGRGTPVAGRPAGHGQPARQALGRHRRRAQPDGPRGAGTFHVSEGRRKAGPWA